jgi:DNA helicase-2/ATP-dependent DNA helicase PcrA
LADGHRNLCVVGDDDQSIYSWRGAEVEHILKFASDWPEAKVVRLEDNYRSTEAILSFANRLIKFNKVRHDKVLRAARPNGERPLMCVFKDEEEEAREVVDRIRTQVARPELEYRDFAILFRTNEQPRAFESELRRLKIPYVLIGGMSFFDRREVRDTMAYLRLLDNPHEEVSLLRVLNTPPRGIGNKTVEQLMSVAVADKKPLWDILCKIPSKAGVSKSAAAAIGRFVNMIETYQKELETKKGTEVIRELLLYIDYRGEIARLHDSTADQDSRWATVEEIVNALGAYEDKKRKKKRTIGEFLDEVAVKGLDDKDAKEDKEKQMRRNAVVLMTLHAAKGLEFPNVFMVGMEEGLLPHVRSIKSENAADIEEERRLCYVGVTRAEDNLTLTMSKSRRKWGKAQETQPSRFLFELIGKADNAHNRSDAAHKPRKKMARKKKSSARRRP